MTRVRVPGEIAIGAEPDDHGITPKEVVDREELLRRYPQKRLQAKDLDDRLVLAAVHKLAMAPRPNAWGDPPYWVFAWDLEKELGLENTGRLLLAKCEALIKKKLLDGCPCGCRGDFELTRAGRALLDAPVSTSAQGRKDDAG